MSKQLHRQKIEPYQRLAGYYDQLMDYIDYDVWVDDIEALLQPEQEGAALLDISCGTGSMAVRLAQRGWQVSAVDLSPHMVARAQQKARELGVQLQVETGDMTSYRGHGAYAAVINLLDGLNYLLETDAIAAFLNNAYHLLQEGGHLLFDVVTPLLCQTHFRGYREIFSDEQGGYERFTSYDPVSCLAKSVFTLNTDQDDTVEVETHLQRAYELDDVRDFCEKSPFSTWKIMDDETLEPATAESERFLVLMQKQV